MTTKKPVKDAEDPAVAYAKKIVRKLQTDALHFDKNFRELLRIKAWDTLGYESFTKLWVDKFSNTIVGNMLMPMIGTIVDEMLKDGTSLDDMDDVLPGYGPEKLKWMKQQLADGVPPDQVSVTPKQSNEPVSLSLYLGKEQYARWTRIAAKLNKPLKNVALDVLNDFFDNLYDLGEQE
jgi:hypothetical protein